MQIRTRDGHYETRGANSTLPWGNSTPPTNGQLGSVAAGVQVTEHSAMQLAAVWGSVDLMSSAIATLPLRQWRKVGTADAVEMPLAPVIERPWSEMTQRDFVTQGTVSMLLRGNLWGHIVSRDDRLYPTQVQLVHPDHAQVRRDRQTGELVFRYFNEVVPADDVTRAMGMSGPEALQGMNPIECLRNTLGVARAQDLYNGAFFSNSARPDGVIEVPDDLDPEEVKAMMAAWREAHQGISHSSLPAILTNSAKFNPITMKLADAQFLEQMQFSASVISGMIYRVPPHKLGMTDKTTSWGAGIEQQELGWVADGLGIWLARWEDLFRGWLPPRQFVTFDLSQRLRGDSLQRWSSYQIARVIGAMTGEEIRAAEGLPKVQDPTLQAFDQPFNSSPMKAPSSSGVGPGGDKSD